MCREVRRSGEAGIVSCKGPPVNTLTVRLFDSQGCTARNSNGKCSAPAPQHQNRIVGTAQEWSPQQHCTSTKQTDRHSFNRHDIEPTFAIGFSQSSSARGFTSCHKPSPTIRNDFQRKNPDEKKAGSCNHQPIAQRARNGHPD